MTRICWRRSARSRTTRSFAKSEVARRLLVLTAGEGGHDGDTAGVPCRTLGVLAADDRRLEMAYRAADVFVLPSLEDNLPNTLLEAMAAGLPVVAYRTGGIPDVLKDDVNGRVVARGDVAALARALGVLLTNPAERLRLGDRAAITAWTTLDWPIQVLTYERIYADEIALCASRKSRRRSAGPKRRVPASLSKDPRADAPRIKALSTDRPALELAGSLLGREVDELQQVVAARGGEIAALQATAAWHERERQREVAELQEVIAQRGGAIRDLERALESARGADERRRDVLRHLVRPRGAQAPAEHRGRAGAAERRGPSSAVTVGIVVYGRRGRERAGSRLAARCGRRLARRQQRGSSRPDASRMCGDCARPDR